MKAATLSLIIVIALAVPVLAAPGDPRLIQGVLEWPQSLDRYPVLLIRGDDGTLYYANIGSAERRGSPSAGTRIAVLGVEGKHANEVLAMFVATVPDRTPSVAPAVSGGTAATSPVQPPSAAPTPASDVDVARTTPSALAGSSALPAPPTRPAPQPTASTQPPSAQPAPQPTASTGTPSSVPAAAPPQNVALPPAPAQPASPQAGPVAPGGPQMTPAAGAVVVERPRNASPSTEASPRWTETQGIVLALGPRTLVLKADDGQRVVVDVSALSPGIADRALIGSLVKLYGVPIEQRFKATRFIGTVSRPR